VKARPIGCPHASLDDEFVVAHLDCNLTDHRDIGQAFLDPRGRLVVTISPRVRPLHWTISLRMMGDGPPAKNFRTLNNQLILKVNARINARRSDVFPDWHPRAPVNTD
jgi:hypothetical protein